MIALRPSFALLLTWAAVFGLMAASVRGDEPTARYFEGLRQRGLFSVAEGYCLDRLRSERLSLPDRTEWTIELSRTLAEHARHNSGEDQQQLWEKAGDVLRELLERHPENPRRWQVEAQSALVLTSRSGFLAAQAEALPDDAAAVEAAQEACGTAIERLRAIEKQFAAAVQKHRTTTAVREGELSIHEMRNVLETLRHALAVTLLDRARLSPRGSPDRADAAIDAEGILKRQAGGIPGEPLTWNARVLLAECARLQGDARQAGALLTTLAGQAAGPNEAAPSGSKGDANQPPADVLDRIIGIRARTELDAGHPHEAASVISHHFRRVKVLSGELHYLKSLAVAELAAIADAKKDTGLADDLRKQLETQVATAEREVGGWWAWRCRLVLETSQQSREYGPELAPLVRRARAAWGAGRRDEAINGFGEAAAKAMDAGNERVAVEAAFTRASLLLQADRLDEAAAGFRAIPERFPKSGKAADADLMAAYCLGRLYDANATQERREAYVAALDAHRETYADSPTAGEALWMLGVLQERRLQYTQAFRHYRDIPIGHRRGPEAQVAVARVLESIFARLREIQQSSGEWEKAAYERLEATRATFPADEAPLSRDQAEAALRYARLCLAMGRPDYVRADALLARVLLTPVEAADADRESDSPVEDARQADLESLRGLHRSARQLRIVSLAGQKRWTQANQLLDEFTGAEPDEVLAVLKGLSRAGAGFDEATRRGLGDLQYKTAERLVPRRESLTPSQRRQLDECVAEALVAGGQFVRAAAAYEPIVKENPKDKALRRTYAGVLVEAGTPEALAKARTEWRAIEAAGKPGEPDWLEARYQVARCAFLLHDHAESRKLVKVTRVLYPELGGRELAAKFRELEQELGARQ